MQEFLYGARALLIYFVCAAAPALLCRYLIRIPDELFRKILHCILLGSLPVFVFGFDTWWRAAAAAVSFAAVVYPILAWFERFRGYSELTTERKKGELKESLLLVFAMFAVVISVCWGWLHDRYLVLASVYAWGFGDAAAALVGKRWGRHKIRFGIADSHKSLEGSAAMFAVSLISVETVLLLRGGIGSAGYIVIPMVTALVSALAELCSRDGHDTVICPLSAMVVLLPLVHLFGGFA
ncbi:MAG: phosphatidate cytidylyltransferase [Ruminococcaceae bacterium]|nr:phosphatidate cytidylyltransferase [Oscillospiraceae bacterium]